MLALLVVGVLMPLSFAIGCCYEGCRRGGSLDLIDRVAVLGGLNEDLQAENDRLRGARSRPVPLLRAVPRQGTSRA